MAEIESPPVTTEEPGLVAQRVTGTSMLERWVEHDPEKAIERVNILVKTLEQLRIASIRATYPSDWIIHTTKDRSSGEVIKQVGYLQDSGAERAAKPWGIEVGNPAIEREDFPDGTYSYHMIADAWSKITGERLDYTEGSRWSGDHFFQRPADPDYRIDPTDVRKSAYANLHGRAVRALSGLNGVPLDMLRQAGLDVAKCVHVTYDPSAKGGQSAGVSLGTADIKVAFGRQAGKTPAELEDKDLAWYVKVYTDNVADPGKAKFVKANQRVLDALKAEQERRAQAMTHEAETGTKASPAAEGEGASAGRGTQLADLHARLQDAVKDGRLVAPLLRVLTKEKFGREKAALSELTDEELGKLNEIPEDILARVAQGVTGGEGKGAKK